MKDYVDRALGCLLQAAFGLPLLAFGLVVLFAATALAWEAFNLAYTLGIALFYQADGRLNGIWVVIAATAFVFAGVGAADEPTRAAPSRVGNTIIAAFLSIVLGAWVPIVLLLAGVSRLTPIIDMLLTELSWFLTPGTQIGLVFRVGWAGTSLASIAYILRRRHLRRVAEAAARNQRALIQTTDSPV